MPKMNGLELCRAIKSNVKTNNILVILLTVLTNIKNHTEGFDLNADDYITKPFNLHMLEARILNLIEARKNKIDIANGDYSDFKIFTSNISDEKFMKKAIDVVEKNLANIEFTAEDFADQIGISRSNLHLKLKSLTNQSATEFIRIIRLKKSIELLSSHQYNISEVSYMVGFNSISYFNRCFKQQFGFTPSEYLADGLNNKS
jgi:AraC-like DNA-binding protein